MSSVTPLADTTNVPYDEAMVDTTDASQPVSSTNKISKEEYEKQAEEYTEAQIKELNQHVRDDPSIGGKSKYFQDKENIKRGLPVFKGTHTRFVYDNEDDVVGTEDATNAPIPGPELRTVGDFRDVNSEEDEVEDGEEEYYENYTEEDEEVQSESHAEDDATVDEITTAVNAMEVESKQNTHIRFTDNDDNE